MRCPPPVIDSAMHCSRRHFVIAAGVTIVAPWTPRHAHAQSAAADREHQVKLEMPWIAEDPAAVPVQVSVDHPMEPDHYIRSIDVVLEKDPVPHKGKFVFTPANGRAWAAFTVRSGTGGLVKATAECSRHGRFVGTREVRVAEGGCAGVEPIDRQGLGN